MSWYQGMKAIQLSGIKSIKLTIPTDVLRDYGSFYPLLIDVQGLLDVVFNKSLEAIIGSGNYAVLNDQFADFAMESYGWPNLFTEHDDELMSCKQDLDVIIGATVLSIDIENEFTNRQQSRDNLALFVIYPDSNKANAKMSIWLGGFFSPVQELIMASFNDLAKDSLFHEFVHALKRSGDDLLKDIMYGGSEAAVTEEIMTHMITDKFTSFSKLKDILSTGINVSMVEKDGWQIPSKLELSPAAQKLFGGLEPSLNTVVPNSKQSKKHVGLSYAKAPASVVKQVRQSLKLEDKGRKHSLKDNARSLMVKHKLLRDLPPEINFTGKSLKSSVNWTQNKEGETPHGKQQKK